MPDEAQVTATETEQEPTETPVDLTAEAEKWKALARKHEERAKANAEKAKRLDQLEESSKSDLEKATARAEAAESEAVRTRRENVALIRFKDPALSSLLSGNTREEIEASAEILASHITASKPVEPKSLKSGASGGDGSGMSAQERAVAAVRELRGSPN